jgi:hypothetical protein
MHLTRFLFNWMNVPTGYHYRVQSETGNEESPMLERVFRMQDIKWPKPVMSLTDGLLRERVNNCKTQENLALQIISERTTNLGCL